MQSGNCIAADAVVVQTEAAIKVCSTYISGHKTMHLQMPGVTIPKQSRAWRQVSRSFMCQEGLLHSPPSASTKQPKIKAPFFALPDNSAVAKAGV